MKVICYTRLPKEDAIYSTKLAYSMHLAIQEEDGTILALNHNSGILYAKATQNEDGTLNAMNLKNPWLFEMKDGTFGVVAGRINPDGSEDVTSVGKLLFFTSKDLIHYEEQPLLDLGRGNSITDAVSFYRSDEKAYVVMWQESDGEYYSLMAESLDELADSSVMVSDRAGFEKMTSFSVTLPTGSKLPEGAVLRNVLEVSDKVAKRLKFRFITPENTANEVPDRVSVSSLEELNEVRAVAKYTDGSSVEKRVDWYAEGIDWNTPGEYRIRGRIHQNRYEFPVAWNKADPCVAKWNGKYYFISTNDLDREHSVYIREADSIPELVTAQQIKILDAYTYPHLVDLLWAPELHIINGRLYVLHAGTAKGFWEEQCHVMALKEGGNPTIASDWEMPVRVIRKDGSYLYGEQGITLDMTHFEAGGVHYVCWSQRQFKPVDQGAWLYIACVDPDRPWQLTTDPVVLSMPEYGWANNHTFVDEGPFALFRDGKIYLTFSSAAVDSTYVVGLMTADPDTDLTNPDNWVKENYPLLSSRSAEGEYGTGHNAYVTDDDGLVWNTYHARPGVEGPRSSGIRRVHFNIEGFPVLDMTEEKDVKPELALIETTVVIA